MKKTAIVIGATGLIGRNLLNKLLASDSYSKVIAIGRRPSGQKHAKLQELITSLDNLSTVDLGDEVDEAFCCLGTTMHKAGSKAAFYKVDYTYVKDFAVLCQSHGVRFFSVVSAIGADATSVFYYNRVKGQIEDALCKMDFAVLQIFRPSLLLGSREEIRVGEDLSKVVMGWLSPVVPDKYKGIQGAHVAEAMLCMAAEQAPGVHIYPSDQIQRMVREAKEV